MICTLSKSDKLDVTDAGWISTAARLIREKKSFCVVMTGDDAVKLMTTMNGAADKVGAVLSSLAQAVPAFSAIAGPIDIVGRLAGAGAMLGAVGAVNGAILIARDNGFQVFVCGAIPAKVLDAAHAECHVEFISRGA